MKSLLVPAMKSGAGPHKRSPAADLAAAAALLQEENRDKFPLSAKKDG